MIDLPPSPQRDYESERVALVQQVEKMTPVDILKMLEDVAKFIPPVVENRVETFVTATGTCDGYTE